MKANAENEEKSQQKDGFLIVGIGASAGGVQALKEFFQQVPADSGIAYVVILHLSPDYDSHLTTVLQAVCQIPVSKVTEKEHVLPDNVYVVPPNGSLKMVDGSILVEKIHTQEERRAPIDIFFRTLAESHKSAAVAVVLSGTGADGSMGLKRVKENGGVVYVQNPREAEYSDMPRNAIATDLVDEVVNVAQIPAKIIAYKNNIGAVEIPISADELEEEGQAALREIFTQLRIRTGHDFSNYKRATIMRRVERRINVHNFSSLADYATFLRNTPEETTALLKDLLISVTNFFRDKEAFNFIEHSIIPKVLAGKSAGDAVRVWVAGCATGEEAYSLAMLFYEQMYDKSTEMPSLQIFASDIDDAAIATAREGFYTLNDAADISQERLRRFFIPENEGYRVRKELREVILFANHNVLKDPPFSHLNLITCRNMLIYLNQEAQNRLMEAFHFALNPGDFLFLGSSESVDGANDLYASVSKEYQVFQSRHTARRIIPLPDSSFSPALQFKTPEAESSSFKKPAEQESRALERISLADLHQRLLEQYAPPSLVINESHDVVHISNSAGRFLQVTGGEPSTNILKLVKQELRVELRTALYQAMHRHSNVEIKNLAVQTGSQVETINLHIRPVLRAEDTARGFMLILFEPSQEKPAKDVVEILSGTFAPITLQLEEELNYLKSQLRSSNEQFEIQTEELKASNEELQAINEELRSASEELETSKEELQSINEELITVNQELKVKIEEVSQSNNDFLNLINSIDIGTIFLDRNFQIKLYTPAIRDIFNLIQADIGRPLSDITSRLEYDNLLPDVESVLQNLQPIEREVKVVGGRTFLMQIQPYRTSEDHIRGIVIVFVNITQRKHSEEAMRAVDERMRLIVESAKDYAIFTFDLDRCIDSWNTGAEAVFGYTEHEIIGKSSDILFTSEDRKKSEPEHEAAKAYETGRAANERWHNRKNGSRFYGSGIVSPLSDNAGNTIGFLKIMRDLTQQKQAEEALKEGEQRLRITLEAGEMGAWNWNVDTNEVMWNEQHFRLLGIEPKQELTNFDYFLQFIHPEDLPGVNSAIEAAISKTGVFSKEYRIVRKSDNQVCWVNGFGRVTEWQNGKALRLAGVTYDVTERRQAADALLAAQNSLNTALDAAQMGVWNLDLQTGIVTRSARHDQLLGYDNRQEDWNIEKAKKFVVEEDKSKLDVAYQGITATGVFDLEIRVEKKYGIISWVHYYGRLFKNEKGEFTHAAGVIFDITDRKTIEQKKDEFIGVASHELKTPVTSIKAYAEILRDQFEEAGDEQSAFHISKLNSQVDRLTKLIKDLLDATRISEGRMVFEEADVDINKLLRETADNLQLTTNRHTIVLDLQEIPLYKGDSERLHQVFINLVANAIKYSPEADKILVKTSRDNGNIYIEVADFGIGMSAETQSKLFERFFRSSDPNNATFPGLGLGLYISLEIVKQHNGTIKVQSERGKGSVFIVILPVPQQEQQ